MSLALLRPEGHMAISKDLARQLQRMQDAHGAYSQAIEHVTNLAGYSFYCATTAFMGVAFLRGAAAAQGYLTPDVSRQLDDLAFDYLNHIRDINDHAAQRIIALADDVAGGRVGVIEAIARLLPGGEGE